ncbi:hypothetical protein EDD99_5059 [Streptomyces sp. 846.5]|nr:tetratricopeptide repeat protein [Streptomyces sp. 846.5]TDU06500.1 hypothetical protein EDD99_5059 [Streptomyces sp. 846.5]
MSSRETRRASYPLTISDQLLNSPAMQSACQSRDVQEIFRLVNRRAGGSYADIAAAVGKISSARVGDTIRGVRKIRGAVVIARIADGFGIPGQLLGIPTRSWEETTPSGPPEDRPANPGLDTAVRDFETWEVVDTLTRSSISGEALLHLEAAVYRNATLYPASPPGELMPSMLKQITKIRESLDHPQPVRVRRKCVQLLGVLSGLAGNAFLDLGDSGQSTALYHLGRLAADEAEDDALSAWLLTLQSIGPYFSQTPHQAVELLGHAASLAEGAPSRRCAWIMANQARAHAAVGERTEALAALDRAAEQLAQADPASGIDFFNEARLEGISGTAFALLGDYSAAETLLTAAVDRRASGDVKGRALLTFDLAECRIGQGEIDEGCTVAHAALDMAAGSLVQPIVTRSQRFGLSLAGWQDAGPVAALTERIEEAAIRAVQ